MRRLIPLAAGKRRAVALREEREAEADDEERGRDDGVAGIPREREGREPQPERTAARQPLGQPQCRSQRRVRREPPPRTSRAPGGAGRDLPHRRRATARGARARPRRPPPRRRARSGPGRDGTSGRRQPPRGHLSPQLRRAARARAPRPRTCCGTGSPRQARRPCGRRTRRRARPPQAPQRCPRERARSTPQPSRARAASRARRTRRAGGGRRRDRCEASSLPGARTRTAAPPLRRRRCPADALRPGSWPAPLAAPRPARSDRSSMSPTGARSAHAPRRRRGRPPPTTAGVRLRAEQPTHSCERRRREPERRRASSRPRQGREAAAAGR